MRASRRLSSSCLLVLCGLLWAAAAVAQGPGAGAVPDTVVVEYAPQGRTWISTGSGTAQFQLLVDGTTLPGEAVQIAAYRQAAGSVSVVHEHCYAEIFVITSGELVNVLRHRTTKELTFYTVRPGMAGVVPATHDVVHWVPSETEPAEGFVVWSGREAEHLEDVGFAQGPWQAPFGVDRRVLRADLPHSLVEALEGFPPAPDR